MIFRRMDPSRIVDPASDGVGSFAPQEASLLGKEIAGLVRSRRFRSPDPERDFIIALHLCAHSMSVDEATKESGLTRHKMKSAVNSLRLAASDHFGDTFSDEADEEVHRQSVRRVRLQEVRKHLGFDFAREWPLNSAMRACHKCQRIVLVRDMNLDRYVDADCPACGRTTQDLVPMLEQALEARPDDRSAWLSHIADMRRRFD